MPATKLSIPDTALEQSAFLQVLAALKGDGLWKAPEEDTRSLSEKEIEILERQGNWAENWATVKVVRKFNPSYIRQSCFRGDCVIGLLDGTPVDVGFGPELPSGIVRSTIIDSVVSSGCCVRDVGLISRMVVSKGATIMGVGSVAAGTNCRFGTGIEVSLGLETGGREVGLFPELSVELAYEVATRKKDSVLQQKYADFVQSYVERTNTPFGVIGSDTRVLNTTSIRDSFIGPHAVVQGAQVIENSAVLSTKEETTFVGNGAIVRDSAVQWGCRVTDMAIVEKSVLVEHSHVERHGKVTESVIGANTGIAEGEVTASLVGPFVGFHHQALLIAAMWPKGKGNVGYGANVGSNHTGKAPDQELRCGEGVFFGLSVNAKYPLNLEESPYSIIATGVDMAPQKISFPFSLINTPSRSYESVSPGHTELFPGWVLSNNMYALMRNRAKFRKRNRARRSNIPVEIFRPIIVDMMIRARDRLMLAPEGKPIYTAKDIEGLGKNFITRRSCRTGIEAYNLFVEYYALAALKTRVANMMKRGDAKSAAMIYAEDPEDVNWTHARGVLELEGYIERPVGENLQKLITLQARIESTTRTAKERDDGRGGSVIDDYAEVHKPAAEDPIVLLVAEETEKLKAYVETLLDNLPPGVE